MIARCRWESRKWIIWFSSWMMLISRFMSMCKLMVNAAFLIEMFTFEASLTFLSSQRRWCSRNNLNSYIIRCQNFYVDSENKWKKISAIHLIFNSTLALSRKHSGKWNVGNKSAWMYTTIIDLSPLCVINLSNPVAREKFGRVAG